ncbi:MAG: hypothetical protein FJY97_05540 [candidate division Zixibacteria bacterium]|nr:hypothetical protein [candidate division Zixibacteria bacterium]
MPQPGEPVAIPYLVSLQSGAAGQIEAAFGFFTDFMAKETKTKWEKGKMKRCTPEKKDAREKA